MSESQMKRIKRLHGLITNPAIPPCVLACVIEKSLSRLVGRVGG
jgi:hypothetical protein